MKRAIFWLLIGVGAVVATVCLVGRHNEVMATSYQFQPPASQPAQQPIGGGELIAVPGAPGEKGQLLTVLDPHQQAMGVYWIEAGTGKISLRSVRNIRYDLMMTDFNGDSPLPREIRLQLEQR